MTLAEIAKYIDGEIVGDAALDISGIAGIKEAKPGDITFLANAKYESLLNETSASAVLVAKDCDLDTNLAVIKTKDPSYAFSKVITLLNPDLEKHFEGIDDKAVVADSVRLGDNVAVGPCAIIEEGAVVGEGTVVYAGVYIGRDAVIGKNCILYPNLTIRERCVLGDNVIIHSGTVIGSDGFGFATIDGEHKKIPQVGIVEIEDDVEIGSNVTVDRARFDKTLIRRGAKIDNLVQIAHNVEIGQHALVVAQVGISGSTKVGKYAILAGQVGVAGHLEIGDQAVVGAQGGVTKSLEGGKQYWGTPARDMKTVLREQASLIRLPDAMKRIKALEKEINAIKESLNND